MRLNQTTPISSILRYCKRLQCCRFQFIPYNSQCSGENEGQYSLVAPPPHLPSSKKNNNKNKFLDLPLDLCGYPQKSNRTGCERVERVKEKSEIGKGSTVVWGLDKAGNEINSPCHWQIQLQTVFTFLSSNSFSYSRSNRISPCQW